VHVELDATYEREVSCSDERYADSSQWGLHRRRGYRGGHWYCRDHTFGWRRRC